MRLLVLGGTEFVGRAIVSEALALGWDVTTFNRGTSSPLPGVTALRGDRLAPDGLAALQGHTWDAVADTWSKQPSVVRDSASALAGSVGRYVYISSRSVYGDPLATGGDELSPLVDGDPDETSNDEYPRVKRGGELAVLRAIGPERTLLARPGLILGPWENVGRLPWWLNRIARGGDILAPGSPDGTIQYIDTRDLAAWCLEAAEAGLAGEYSLVGQRDVETMGTLLDACLTATGSTGTLRWTNEQRILDAGVESWTQLPIWAAAGELHDWIHEADVSKVFAAGLRTRPLADTVADTWAWLQSIGGIAPQRPDRPQVGIDDATERAILGRN